MPVIHNYHCRYLRGRVIIRHLFSTPDISGVSFILALLAIFICLWQSPALADHTDTSDLHIAVLYPTVSKQYSGMFDQLIAGIKSVPGVKITSYRVNSETTPQSIRQWSQKKHISGYIALGQTTYKLVDSMGSEHPLIAGGMVATPPDISGISLSGDPEAFFRQLQLLNPGINRVFFVYNPQNNGWLVRRAREISKNYGVEFIPLQVNDLKEATLQYKIVLNSVRARTDAIWIPLDNVAPLDILLPEILRVSWNKHITVFSNNLLHARRGTLFALYPDHYKQGRRLMALMIRHLEKPPKTATLYPSVDLKTAVNIRTARHLDMQYSREMVKKFDQIYPAFN